MVKHVLHVLGPNIPMNLALVLAKHVLLAPTALKAKELLEMMDAIIHVSLVSIRMIRERVYNARLEHTRHLELNAHFALVLGMLVPGVHNVQTAKMIIFPRQIIQVVFFVSN